MELAHARAISILIFASLGLCACAARVPSDPAPATNQLTGEVVYHDPVLLPGDAVTYVSLHETCPAGTTTVVARARVDSCISPPLPFRMAYESDALDPQADHCLLTETFVDGQRHFAGREEISADEAAGREGSVRIVADRLD